MEVLKTISAFREARANLGRLGLVPTMGYLHEGHLSLVRQARAECGAVAVSIFVNPTQFGPREDLSRYPRDLERDLRLLREEHVDLVFVPDVAEIYPPGFSTYVDVREVTEMLEGAVRPGHFQGVATVVCKLFNIAQPTRAYFGQKDAQQTVVVRTMVRDLNMPLEVVVAPTLREPDGLAMSSRNVYLSAEQRRAAPALYRALQAAGQRYAAGERDAEALRQAMRVVLDAEPLASAEYVSVADALTLRELDQVGPAGALCSLAVRFGSTRLIDNMLLEG
jgi:pantoate--beta-alanine ligase